VRALSIKQPWAWAILHGKDIENRTWPTHYTGEFLIHASKTFDFEGLRWMLYHKYSLFASTPIPGRDEFLMGGIVGKSKIIDCVSDHPSPFFFGPWGFVLKNSVEIDFIPCKGQRGFFYIETQV